MSPFSNYCVIIVELFLLSNYYCVRIFSPQKIFLIIECYIVIFEFVKQILPLFCHMNLYMCIVYVCMLSCTICTCITQFLPWFALQHKIKRGFIDSQNFDSRPLFVTIFSRPYITRGQGHVITIENVGWFLRLFGALRAPHI